ncbi:unnamed protein product [Dibothriocephalus latus]|uniref:Uncharacterized protein n=1 Tax=Dibothriocephalus latus TaxID=60516 RepID=A0A3P7M9A9_DIBLA|nr:unnamed protein product [Dibothriocephalus latus]
MFGSSGAVRTEDVSEATERIAAGLGVGNAHHPKATKAILLPHSHIAIVPTNKARPTVALDRSDCLQKAKNLLKDGQFDAPRNTFPLKRLTREIDVTLLALEDSAAITPTGRRMARVQETALVHCYALPKVHKESTLLRPIVSLKALQNMN